MSYLTSSKTLQFAKYITRTHYKSKDKGLKCG